MSMPKDSAFTPTLNQIIPRPVSVKPTRGAFTLKPKSVIHVKPATAETIALGQYLADKLNASTGYQIKLSKAMRAPAHANIFLALNGADPALGEEGYELMITSQSVKLVAYRPAGLFYGIQTIRQLLPPPIESSTAQAGSWKMAAGVIRDYPRFVWRGAMLDVARHFFSVQDVKRYIDRLAYYKLNRLHLHLTDDQGWRIQINSWPNLTAHGGSTQVGGGPGGYYTQAEYSDLVAYAQSRSVTIVPEIDTPGHTNAALASYPELNSNGVAPDLYTGTNVGFSSLCIDKEITYKFLDDVIRELAALTPGAYIHIGGDEAASTPMDDYLKFIPRIQAIVQAHGKQMIGWEEIAQVKLASSSIVQPWNGRHLNQVVAQGVKVILSPADKTYMDMKYDETTPLGLHWAGYIDVPAAYDWDPVTQVPGMLPENILGVEAPLWTETIQTIADIEYMAFPRLCGYAEIAWSPAANKNWDEYKVRLGTHGPRFTAQGVNFYRSPHVPWK